MALALRGFQQAHVDPMRQLQLPVQSKEQKSTHRHTQHPSSNACIEVTWQLLQHCLLHASKFRTVPAVVEYGAFLQEQPALVGELVAAER
jgi:hypothetical protein